MKTGLIITIGIVLVLVIVLVIFMASKSKATAAAAQAASNPAVAVVPACEPYSQAQQNAEKTRLRSKCASKLLIPFVGQIQYYSCMKQIPTQLQPVKTC